VIFSVVGLALHGKGWDLVMSGLSFGDVGLRYTETALKCN